LTGVRALRARLGPLEVGEGLPVRIMGAMNASPESFYIGSLVRSPAEAVATASRMLEEGADLIDVGGMSTAPYVESRAVPPEVEASRVVPLVSALKRELGAVVSVDTVRASVAEAALAAGADAVNDVSGCKADPLMARTIASHGASAVVGIREEETATSGSPVLSARSGLAESLRICGSAGVDAGLIVLDPGIGFFRGTGVEWYERDSEVLGGIRRLLPLLRPILVGVSRKSFIGRILGIRDPRDRLTGTVAAEAIAVFAGAHAIRAHDVQEAAQAARLGEALRPRLNASGDAIEVTRFLEPEDGWTPGDRFFAVLASGGELGGALESVGGRALEVAPGAILVRIPAGRCPDLGGSGIRALESIADICTR
jgi:dihydropteroate synthase